MKNKFTLALAAFITVVVITVGIGVITKVSANNNPQVISKTNADTTEVSQREQAYQQIVAQANQQMAEANQQIATMANQLSQVPTSEPTLDNPSVYLFSAEQASALAQQVSGVAPKNPPELVNFSGTPAYEVVFGNGKVYIDANSGAFLFNGLQKQVTKITGEKAYQIASNYLKTSQPIAMNISSYNGVKVFVVLFADGQSVFVDTTGKIVAVQMPAPSQPSNNSTSVQTESKPSEDHDD
jgi:hypothetical protein